MQTNSKKYLISQVSQEKITIRKSVVRSQKMICPICETETEMLSLDSAVTVSQVPTRQILESATRKIVHLLESESGHIWVCRNSLEAIINKNSEKKLL